MNDEDRKPRCDFCGIELRFGSSWLFPCHDTEVDPIPEGMPKLQTRIGSEGNWGACDSCKRLIVAGKRDKLAKRGTRAVPAPPGTDPKLKLAIVRQVQDTFWANRSGPPWLETREEWDQGVEPPRFEGTPYDEGGR